MSSTIFYRFKSQKDTSRLLFDGTGLTVFDLKRGIILDNKLGDGTDFQLRIYNPDTNEEYEEDQIVIPRSSSVIVKRSPAAPKPSLLGSLQQGGIGSKRVALQGNATRYVTGRPRVFQSSSRRLDTGIPPNAKTGDVTSFGSGNPAGTFSFYGPDSGVVSAGSTEEERIANMFATQENQWEKTQQEMFNATPVFFKNQGNSHNNLDEGPPPPGYMCYRCGSRDHWIRNCPTINDPNFEGKRIRRTTGIPKKFLKTVKIDPGSMTAEELAERKIMVTDEGEFVVQVADVHSWEDYQRKQQKRSIDADDAVWQRDHFDDLPEDLKCPITGGLLKNPVRTTKCCNKCFSKDAIEDALLETDFVCPACNKADIWLDSLADDEQKEKEVQEFLSKHKQQSTSVGVTSQGKTAESDSSVTGEGADGHIDKKSKLGGATANTGPTGVIGTGGTTSKDGTSSALLSSPLNPGMNPALSTMTTASAPPPPLPVPVVPFGMAPFPMFPIPPPPPFVPPNVTGTTKGSGNSNRSGAGPTGNSGRRDK